MNDRNVIILRGVAGAGKSAFANLIVDPCCVCCADDYLYDSDGVYMYTSDRAQTAHEKCKSLFDEALIDPLITNIVVANTNTDKARYSYYEDAARKAGIRVTFVVLENRHGNRDIHSVPDNIRYDQEAAILADIQLK